MSKFGPIKNAYYCKQHRKGPFMFGFVVFKRISGLENALKEGFVVHNDKKIMLRKAEDDVQGAANKAQEESSEAKKASGKAIETSSQEKKTEGGEAKSRRSARLRLRSFSSKATRLLEACSVAPRQSEVSSEGSRETRSASLTPERDSRLRKQLADEMVLRSLGVVKRRVRRIKEVLNLGLLRRIHNNQNKYTNMRINQKPISKTKNIQNEPFGGQETHPALIAYQQQRRYPVSSHFGGYRVSQEGWDAIMRAIAFLSGPE